MPLQCIGHKVTTNWRVHGYLHRSLGTPSDDKIYVTQALGSQAPAYTSLTETFCKGVNAFVSQILTPPIVLLCQE